MGQKKQRNKIRNTMKKVLRQQIVDVQNKNHDAAVYADAMTRSAIRPDDGFGPIRKAMDRYERIDPSEFYIDCDEPEYRVMIEDEGGLQTIENARQVEIDLIVARLANLNDGLAPSYDSEIMGYRPRLYRKQEDGTFKFFHAGKHLYDTIWRAQEAGGKLLPVVAIKKVMGFEYPYMDETKERYMREARERRETRRRKAMATLGVMASFMGGGL